MNFRQSVRSWLFADQPARAAGLSGYEGATGVQFLAGQIKATEFNAALTGSKAVAVYEKMRREAMVRATLQLINLPIRAAQWEIDCADEEVRDFLTEALFRRLDFDQYLCHCLLAFPFGHEIMEKVWKAKGGKYWLEAIEHRAQSTIWEWLPDAATGQLTGFVQQAWKGSGYQRLTVPKSPGLDEARLKLVHLAWDQEGNNFEGISGLRSAYPYWKGKTEVYSVAAIALERFGLGIPIAEPPYDENLMQGRFTPDDKTAAETILKNIRAGGQAFIWNPGGWKFDILGTGEANRYDPMPFLQYCDQMIAMNILAQAINLGTTATGSRAVAESQFGMFLLALETVANLIRSRTNKWVIEPLVELNFPSAPPASLRWSDLEVKNKALVADYVAKLELAGLLTPDEDLEDHLRSIGDLPLRPGQEQQKAGEPHRHSRRTLSVGMRPEYWRELTEPERAMALAEIKGRQDDAREHVAQVFERTRESWLRSLKEQLEQAVADGEYSDLDEIEVPPALIKPSQKQIVETLRELYRYGRQTIADELRRQRRARGSEPAAPALREEPPDAAEMTDLFWTRSGKYLRRLSRAVEERAIEQAIGLARTKGGADITDADLDEVIRVIAEGGLYERTAVLEAQVLVTEAINLGRDAGAMQVRDDIEKAVYSAILDERVCDTCVALDGEEYELGEPDYFENAPPNKNCESTASGTNYCRCLYVYVSKDEAKSRG